jgi:hypothetical protein
MIYSPSSNRIMADPSVQVDFLPFYVVFAAQDNPRNWSRQLAGFASNDQKNQFFAHLNRVPQAHLTGDLWVMPNGNAVRDAVTFARHLGARIYDLPRVWGEYMSLRYDTPELADSASH